MISLTKSVNTASLRSLLILLMMFVYVFMFSNYALWLGDDIFYGYKVLFDHPQIPGDHIASFSDVVDSQWNHYFVVNGRVVAHFIVQLVIPFMNKTLFSILNGLAYCLFVYLVVLIGYILREGPKSITCNPLFHWKAFGYVSIMTIIALTLKYVPTSAMYIWMYDLVLIYLYILLNCPSSPVWVLLLLPFSIIAGNAHESINIGLSFGLLLYGLRKIKKLSFNEYVMLMGFATGVLLIALSPASRSRVGAGDSSIIRLTLSLIYLRATFVLALIIISALRNKTLTLKELWQIYGCVLIAILVQIAFCFAIKNTGPRPQYGAEVLALICSIALWNKANIGKQTVTMAFVLLLIMLGWKTVRDVECLISDRAEYVEVRTKFMTSKTGTIIKEFPSGKSPMARVFTYFFGRPSGSVCSFDTALRNYEIMNLQKQFNYELGLNKELRFITPLSIDIYKYPNANTVIETQPGNFYAIISKTHPAKKVTVYRSAFDGLLPWDSYTLYPNAGKPSYETSLLEAYAAFDQMYFVGIDSVVVTE